MSSESKEVKNPMDASSSDDKTIIWSFGDHEKEFVQSPPWPSKRGRFDIKQKALVASFLQYAVLIQTRFAKALPNGAKIVETLQDSIDSMWVTWCNGGLALDIFLSEVQGYIQRSCADAKGFDVIRDFALLYDQKITRAQRNRKS